MVAEAAKGAGTAAVMQLAVSSVMLLIQLAIFFVSAGYVGIRPWILYGASFVHYTVSIIAQYKLNPELLAARLVIRRKGSKRWDEGLMRASNLVVLIAFPVAAGLDVGRFHWTDLDVAFMVPGFILLIISTLLLNWAMAVNLFFEPTMRIQTERGHTVITNGPYQFVRHPGYLAGLAYIFAAPLLVGSAAALIPAGAYLMLIILRTLLEDRTLTRELQGYEEYARKVRYRLLPGVW
jgi:protein-S-isoprenylcysteine O-methyltransferase Ste14